MATWDDLLRAVRIFKGDRLFTADDDALDAFEARRSFELPGSYREFARKFGAGSLGRRDFLVAVPGLAHDPAASDLDRMADRNHELVRSDVSAADYVGRMEDPDRAMRLVFFAENDLGDSFGWDPAELTESSSSEYAVYGRIHGKLEPIRVAPSFAEFLSGYALGKELDRWMAAPGPTEEEDGGEPPETTDMDTNLWFNPG